MNFPIKKIYFPTVAEVLNVSETVRFSLFARKGEWERYQKCSKEGPTTVSYTVQATIKGFGISSDQGDCSVRCQLKSVLHGVNEPPVNFLKNICASVHANLIPKIN